MTFTNQFSNLPHRFFNEAAKKDKIIKQILEDLPSNLSDREVHLYHSDPLFFSIAFLVLIDHGATPICLNSPPPLATDTPCSFINGQWINKHHHKTSRHKVSSYGVFTSGTTNQARLFYFSVSSAMKLAVAHADSFIRLNIDFILQTLPIQHAFGLIAYIFTPLTTGIPITYCPGLISPESMTNSGHQKLALHTSPSQARFMLTRPSPNTDLTYLSIGGGEIYWKELKVLSSRLPNCETWVTYGLTEAGPRVSAGRFSSDLNFQPNDCWIGDPLINMELTRLNYSRLGIRSPHMHLDCDPQLLIDQKWFPTRDHVKEIEHSHQLVFIGREDDIIKVGGISIYPKEIENQIRNWPEVTDVIILKKTDLMYGEKPIIFIEGTLSKKSATEKIRYELPHSSHFGLVYVMKVFPRHSLQKIQRDLLLKYLEGNDD